LSRVRPAGAAARLVVLSLLGLLLAACAAERAASVPEPACTTPGGWFDPATGRGIGEAEVLGRASAARTVLLGEVHDDPDHHAWQLTVASALHAHGRPLVIGVEMLPRSAQPALDAWTAGRSSEAEFLKAVRWTETWGHDPELYLPLFRFARDRHIPMLALNVEQTLVAKVARNGWAAVPVAERQGVGDPAPAAEAYRRSLAEVFAAHAGPDDGDRGRFERFAQAQLTWDRAMAEAMAEGAAARPAATVIGIAGRGHVEHGWGISRQLEDLGAAKPMLLLAMRPEEACAAPPGVADAIFVLPAAADGA
jgi:uncharacterized iron-regulated protein